MRYLAPAIAVPALASFVGCASAPLAEAPEPTTTAGPVFAVATPTRLWVGDTLGVRVLASRDPLLAIAIARGPDASNTFTLLDEDIALYYATVPEDE